MRPNPTYSPHSRHLFMTSLSSTLDKSHHSNSPDLPRTPQLWNPLILNQTSTMQLKFIQDLKTIVLFQIFHVCIVDNLPF